VQSEVLVSALHMYRLTRDPLYWDVFEKTWAFVRAHQIDWDKGEWHEIIGEDLSPRGGKAHGWKAAYHNGRAMIEGITLLRQLSKESR
jgi:cellobiose epimerase